MRFSSPKSGQSALPRGLQDDPFLAFAASAFVGRLASGAAAPAGILAGAFEWPDASIHEDLLFFPILAPFEAGSAAADFANLPAETVFGAEAFGLLLGPMDWPEGTDRDGLEFFPTLLPLGIDPVPLDAGLGLVI